MSFQDKKFAGEDGVSQIASLAKQALSGKVDSSDIQNTYSSSSEDPISGKGVADALSAFPEPMVFRGTVGSLSDNPTITSLPVDGSATVGDVYKVITDGTYASQAAKIGDTFICNARTSSSNSWTLIPSGDEPSGTVTNVAVSSTDGSATITGSPITSSGTIDISVVTDSALNANSTKPVQNALLSRLFTPLTQVEYDALTNKDLPIYFIYEE